jgi:hypothetical protein
MVVETIKDILREMREFAETDSQSIGRDVLRRRIQDYADRIKKAHEFELAVEKAKAAGEGYSAGKQSVTDCNHLEAAVVRENRTSQESRQVGNAAKMRQALEKVVEIAKREWNAFRETSAMYEMHKICTAALAAAPRNCDAFSKAEVLEELDRRSFSKEDTIEWLYEEPEGEAEKEVRCDA